MIFNDTDLQKVFDLFENYYNITIKVRDKKIYDCLLTTTFSKSSIEPFEILWKDPNSDIELPQGRLTINSQGIGDAEISVNPQKLKWPLTIRNWKEGDKFFPKGMNGKSKKVKKYFSDEKLNFFQKHSALILTDAENNIIWIIGYRADERYNSSENFIKIQFFKNV